ncbi:unnamed protein product, partial [marine sediment metagenome]
YETEVAARNHPAIIHAAGNIYLIAYYGSGGSWVKSFSIAANGTISKTFPGTFLITNTQNRYFNIIHVSGTVYAVISQYATSIGYMETFSCDAAGNLAEIAQAQMSVGAAFEYNSIIQLYPDYFVMCYRHTTTGRIAVARVTGLGAITRTDEQAFHTHTDFIGFCRCQKVSDGIIAVAFGEIETGGYIQTIAINALGVVTNLSVDSYKFETTDVTVRDLISFGANWFAVIYIDDDGYGIIKSFHIA